jgi:hypothetical protein
MRKRTSSQTSRLEKPEELLLHHNHEKILFLTVLSLFAQHKTNYWWLVTGLDLAFTKLIFDVRSYIGGLIKIKIKIKILGSECQTSGTYAKRAKQATKKDNRLYFLNYLAFLRPAADRAVSILPWVVSRGRSYGFLWAGSIIQKMCGRTVQLRLVRQ